MCPSENQQSSTQKPGSEGRPLRVAVVGSGPSGFYAAEALMKASDLFVHIDMFERLPTPYGLIRAGVAPDHQSVKKVTKVYERAAEDERFRFFGNVRVGADVEVSELAEHYDQIVFAVGNEGDRRLGIPGEYSQYCAPATVFVGWYNGHPDYRTASFALDSERVVVVGNGNVSSDITRILTRDVEALAGTDIAEHALTALRESTVKEVMVLGLGGPGQATYTSKELGELGKLENVDVIVDPADVELDPVTEAHIAGQRRHVANKNMKLFREWATRTPQGRPKRIVFKFFRSSLEVLADDDGRIRGIVTEGTRIVEGPDGAPKIEMTGEREEIPAQMMLTAIGFAGKPLPGVPFNEERKIIANDDGRVSTWPEGETVPNRYVVGWARTGPRGQIGMHKAASGQVVKHMLADLAEGQVESRALPPRSGIVQLLWDRDCGQVTFADWQLLDDAETYRGSRRGAPRVKYTGVEDMLAVMGKVTPGE